MIRFTEEQFAARLAKRAKPSAPIAAPKRSKVSIKKLSPGEELFAMQLRTEKMSLYRREYHFAKPRMWRFDFAWPGCKVAVEIEGGIWNDGAHTRGKHFESDCEKYNRATILGWRVLRFSTGMVESGVALRESQAAIRAAALAML